MEVLEQLEWFANIDGAAVAEDVVSSVRSHFERMSKCTAYDSDSMLLEDLEVIAERYGGEVRAKKLEEVAFSKDCEFCCRPKEKCECKVCVVCKAHAPEDGQVKVDCCGTKIVCFDCAMEISDKFK